MTSTISMGVEEAPRCCRFAVSCNSTTRSLKGAKSTSSISKARGVDSKMWHEKDDERTLLYMKEPLYTLQEIHISHLDLGKRNIIFKYALSGGYVNSLEGISNSFLSASGVVFHRSADRVVEALSVGNFQI